jgi:hypothetical protein
MQKSIHTPSPLGVSAPWRSISLFVLWAFFLVAGLFAIYEASGATPSTLPATQPSAPPIVPAAKLAAMVATTAPGKTLRLDAGDYEVIDPLALGAAGATYDFRLARFVKATPKPTHSPEMFNITADGVTVLGGVYDSPYPASKPNGDNAKVNVYAFIVRARGFVCRGPTVRNVDTGFLLYPGQRDTWIWSPHFTWEIRGDGIYCGGADETIARGGLYVFDGKFDDSQQEHGLRSSTRGFTGGVFVNCNFTNNNHKEPVTVRLGNDFHFYNCTFDSNMGVYLGEDGTPAPAPTLCGGLEFHDCHLIGGGYYNIRQCVTGVLIDGGGVQIVADPLQPGREPVCLVANAGCSGIVLQNLTRSVVRGTTGKPFFRDYTGIKNGVTDGGGNTSINAPAATTQPAAGK